MNLSHQPLRPFGLTVSVDKKENINDLPAKEIKQLVLENKLMLFRGFDMPEKEELRVFAMKMGKLLQWEFGDVMEMKVQQEPKNYLFTNGAVPFHWDGAFYEAPHILLFHCIQASDKHAGGETLFTDTQLIWQHATDAEKNCWQDLKINCETEKLAHYGGAFSTSLVSKHPHTHETVLRFAEPVLPPNLNPVSVNILDKQGNVRSGESSALTEKIYSKNYSYEHVWEPGDLLLADNHVLLHARRAFHAFSQRHLRRIQIL